jgi:regulator of protease activity HflC (stomatin/prohibitin superfamily)
MDDARGFLARAAAIVVVVLVAIGVFTSLRFIAVEGHERVVMQHWDAGIEKDLLGPGTHFYNGFTRSPYRYNIGTQKFIMGLQSHYGQAETVDFPAYTITTGGSGKEQPATFSCTLQYRLDPIKLQQLHSAVQHEYEDLVIKPALTRIISDAATTKTVIDFYSGEGRVALQVHVEDSIIKNQALSDVGIAVETFVIDSIDLDNNYVAEITGRQLATQKKLRAQEETLAANEEAKKVQALAEAEKNKRVVAAEASKRETELGAEAEKNKTVFAAQAEAEKVKALAEADRFRKEQDAKGLLAQGLAEAEVAQKKKMSKYEGESGARQALVEIEIARVELFKNLQLQGVLPEQTFLTLINSRAADNQPLLSIPAVPQHVPNGGKVSQAK